MTGVCVLVTNKSAAKNRIPSAKFVYCSVSKVCFLNRPRIASIRAPAARRRSAPRSAPIGSDSAFSNGRQPICDKSAILSQVTHQVRHRTLRVKKHCGPDHPAGARDHTTNFFYSKGVDDAPEREIWLNSGIASLSRAIVAGRINQPAPESMRFAVDSPSNIFPNL